MKKLRNKTNNLFSFIGTFKKEHFNKLDFQKCDEFNSSSENHNSKKADSTIFRGTFLLIAILILSVIIFVLYPFICMIDRSIHINGIFSVENYVNAIIKYNKQISNSIYVGIIVAIFTSIISVIVTIFISMKNKILTEILTLVILLAFVSPPFVSSLAYIILYGRRGIISYGVLGLSLNPYNKYGIIIMQILQ